MTVTTLTTALALALVLGTLPGCTGGTRIAQQEPQAQQPTAAATVDASREQAVSKAEFEAVLNSLLAETEQGLDAYISELEALVDKLPPEARGPALRALEDARRSRGAALERIRAQIEEARRRFEQPGSP